MDETDKTLSDNHIQIPSTCFVCDPPHFFLFEGFLTVAFFADYGILFNILQHNSLKPLSRQVRDIVDPMGGVNGHDKFLLGLSARRIV